MTGRALGQSKHRIHITSGVSSARKTVEIEGLKEEVRERLADAAIQKSD